MLYCACRRCVSSGDQEAATLRLGGNLCKNPQKYENQEVQTPVPQHCVPPERSYSSVQPAVQERSRMDPQLDHLAIRSKPCCSWSREQQLQQAHQGPAVQQNQARAQMRRLSHITWISSWESTRMSRRVSAFEKKGSGATSLNLGRACSWESGKRCWEDCLMCPSGRRLAVCPEHKLQEGFTWRREIWKHRNITTVHLRESAWEEEAEEDYSPCEVSVPKTLYLYSEAIDFKTTLAEGPGWIWFQEWPGKDPRC